MIRMGIFCFIMLFVGVDLIASKKIIRLNNENTIDSSLYNRKYTTARLIGTPPHIDGILNDQCWEEEGEWSQEFVQQTPVEGGKASQKTVMKILYDNKYIYVAFKCYDSEPEKIQRYVGNRDQFLGDMVGVNFDSYHDQRTGYEFNTTAGGTQIDLMLNNNGDADKNWNAIWYNATAINDSGWTAEFKIPLNQLRYSTNENQVWGMHAWRWISRNSEEDQWSLIPRKNSGFIYSFGELHGISNLPKFHRFEFMPYTIGKAKLLSSVDKNNPFSKKSELNGNFGLNGKIGVGSSFNIDYTINPDFGQVQADPSVMNLSAYETFYAEKRPFFLERLDLLTFKIDDDILFYSRRIGHAPSVVPSEDQSVKKYVNTPENTQILDAVKFTGRTEDGLSIGVLQSFTNKELSEVDSAGVVKKPISEPYTNYTLFRIQKDYNKGNTIIGGILTSTNRSNHDSVLNVLSKDTYTGGIDFVQYFLKRNYYIDFKAIYSKIKGRREAIINIQESSVHYFQREGASYLGVDSIANNLVGYGGKIALGKTSNSNFSYEESFSWRSPGLELNDIGFQQRADLLVQNFKIRYVNTVPTNLFREFYISLENTHHWNYGGEHEQNTYYFETYFNFTNKWSMWMWAFRHQSGIDTRELRGGPALRLNPYWHFGVSMNTGWQRPVVFSMRLTHSFDNISNSYDYQLSPGLFFRISSRFDVSNSVSYSYNNYDMMYVSTVETDTAKCYFMGRMNQKTYNYTLRANFNITPKISILYYSSPFISTGHYKNFKRIINGKAKNFNDRFILISDENTIFNSSENKYYVTENGHQYIFDNPDFNTREFKSNFVFRWEFKPGSIVYIVWAHNQSYYDQPYNSSLKTSIKDLFDATSKDIIMIKLNYYFAI